MLLFYIRHGDPIYDPDGLTELGKMEAEALVLRMKECKPDRIFASSSKRAIMTAEPTAKYFNKEIEILDWCNESYVGREFSVEKEEGGRSWCFHDRKMRSIFCSDEIRKLDKNWYDHPAFRETLFKSGIQRVQCEVDKLMRLLGYEHDRDKNGYIPIRSNDDRIAMFAHQGFGFVFLSCLLDIPYPIISTRFDMSTSNMTVIEFSGEEFVIPKVLQTSNDSHIFASGMSTDYHRCIHF